VDTGTVETIWIMATTGDRRIRDDTGVCHLQVDELARELGIPSNWGDLEKIPG
jgi:hypothetical protein